MVPEQETFGRAGITLRDLRKPLYIFVTKCFEKRVGSNWVRNSSIDTHALKRVQMLSGKLKTYKDGSLALDCRDLLSLMVSENAQKFQQNWRACFEFLGDEAKAAAEGLLSFRDDAYGHNQELQAPHSLERFLRDAEVLMEAIEASGEQKSSAEVIHEAKRALTKIRTQQAELATRSSPKNVEELRRALASIKPYEKEDIWTVWPEKYYATTPFDLTCGGMSVTGPIPEMVLFDNTDQNFRPDQIRFELLNSKFDLDERLRNRTAATFNSYLAKLRIIFPRDRTRNGEAVHLDSFEAGETTFTVRLRRTAYHNYLRTNLMMDIPLDDGVTVREILHPDGALPSISKSRCGDILGVNLLLGTRDGKIVIQRRSTRVTTFPCLLGPSVSGTVSPNHLLNRHENIRDVLIGGEVSEEISLFSHQLSWGTFRFLGIGRDLIRGGNPDLFFFCNCPLSFNQVQDLWVEARDRDETERLEYLDDAAQFLVPHPSSSALEQLPYWGRTQFERLSKDAAPALLLNLGLWLKSLLRGADRDGPAGA